MPWHRAVAYAFPKDPETGQPTRIDGLAFSRISSTLPGVRLVSRELGITVTMVCAGLPDTANKVTYYDVNKQLVAVQCVDNYIAIKQDNEERKENMEIKMVDIGQIRKQPAASDTKQVEQTPVVTVPERVETVADNTQSIAPVSAVAESATVGDSQAPQAVKTSEELLQEIINTCSELSAMVKVTQAAARAALKAHRTEVKELKSNVKESEELLKLRAQHRKLKALFLEADN